MITKDIAIDMFHRISFDENGSDCWIPSTSTRSLKYKDKIYSLVYLSYILSGEIEPFYKRQEVIRTCGNSNCFNPKHLIFSDKERFRRFIRDDDSGCWNWGGSCDGGGYGVYLSTKHGRIKAHRFSYLEFCGEIPDNLWVLHRCDNPSCVNPEHLFLGTHQDNVDDKVKKGRCHDTKGERNGRSILSEEEVLSIRQEHSNGLSYRYLVNKYGVKQTQIARIVRRESWKWVAG